VLRSSALRLIVLSALGAALLLPPVAHSSRAANLSLEVVFFINGTITVTLNGTAVGTTSGAPTVIPAGVYTLELSGPGGCAYLPLFELKGPGQEIFEDLNGGEVDYISRVVNFLPNSTYYWRNPATPGVIHTFRTSADIVGTAPPPLALPSSGKRSTVENKSIVGSKKVPFRGTLTGAVSAAGRLTVAYKGKSVNTLKPGRYTIAVIDNSSTYGFIVEKLKQKAVGITGAAFVGKRAATVRLTAGKWFFEPRLGKPAYSFVVS